MQFSGFLSNVDSYRDIAGVISAFQEDENMANWNDLKQDYIIQNLPFAASRCFSLMEQLRSGELINDGFWDKSLEGWIKDASLELSVSIQLLRGIQYAPQDEYEAFWKRHGLPIVEF